MEDAGRRQLSFPYTVISKILVGKNNITFQVLVVHSLKLWTTSIYLYYTECQGQIIMKKVYNLKFIMIWRELCRYQLLDFPESGLYGS